MIKSHGAKKLSKTGSHRRAMFANMVSSLMMNEKIVTTFPKAKELRRFADNVIADAKNSKYDNVRSFVRSKQAFKKIVDVIAPRYKTRTSGFTSVMKIGTRRGDATLMAMVKLVD